MQTAGSAPATIHLQSIGLHVAKPVSAVKPGDVLVWNFGYTSEVVDVAPMSAAFVMVTTKSEDGSLWARKMKLSRLVACTRASL